MSENKSVKHKSPAAAAGAGKTAKGKKKGKGHRKCIIDYRVYERPNLGADADATSVAAANAKRKLCVTFRERKHVQEWVEQKGDTAAVYLVEAWVGAKRIDEQPKPWSCALCNLSWLLDGRTFKNKWSWSAGRGWHLSNYVHASEVVSASTVA